MTNEQLERLLTAVAPKPAPDPFQLNGRILGIALAILLAVGIWMVSGLNDLGDELTSSLTSVNVEISALRSDFAVMQAETTLRTADRFTRSDALEQDRDHLEAIQLLERRILALEGKH